MLRNTNKLKGSNMFIYEDFSKATTDLQKEIWKEAKELQNEDNKAYLNDRSVTAKRKIHEEQVTRFCYSFL